MLPRSPTCTVRLGSSRPSSTARRKVVAWLMRVPISVSSVSGCASNCTSPTGRSLAIARRIGSGTVWSPPTAIGVAPMRVQLPEERLDRGEAGRQVHRVDRDVADIGDLAQVERRDQAGRVHQPDGAGRLAHRRRPAAGAGAVVGAEIERDADQCDVDVRPERHTRRAEQRRHVAEAGRDRRVHGPQAACLRSWRPPGLSGSAISCHPGSGVHNPGGPPACRSRSNTAECEAMNRAPVRRRTRS